MFNKIKDLTSQGWRRLNEALPGSGAPSLTDQASRSSLQTQ